MIYFLIEHSDTLIPPFNTTTNTNVLLVNLILFFYTIFIKIMIKSFTLST